MSSLAMNQCSYAYADYHVRQMCAYGCGLINGWALVDMQSQLNSDYRLSLWFSIMRIMDTSTLLQFSSPPSGENGEQLTAQFTNKVIPHGIQQPRRM